MARTDRPSGLTALAIINFLLILYHFVMCIVSAATWWAVKQAIKMLESGEKLDDKQRLQIEVMDPEKLDVVMAATIGAYAVGIPLLLISGLGYLGQRRIAGWLVGNLYGLAWVGTQVSLLVYLPAEMGGEVTIGSMMSVFFPVFTLFLLNFIFRRDLSR